MDIVKDSVNRLVSCGYSDAEAWRIVKDFMKNYYSSKQLIEFIEDVENVDRTQRKSYCEQCGRLCDKSCCTCAKCKLG